jgi:hypothetical protein
MSVSFLVENETEFRLPNLDRATTILAVNFNFLTSPKGLKIPILYRKTAQSGSGFFIA